MDLGLTRTEQRNEQSTQGKEGKNGAHLLMLLETTPKLSTVKGRKYTTTLPTLLMPCLHYSLH